MMLVVLEAPAIYSRFVALFPRAPAIYGLPTAVG